MGLVVNVVSSPVADRSIANARLLLTCNYMSESINKQLKVLLTGGGTLGSVSPLLSVADEIKKRCEKESRQVDFLWLGTWNGPEEKIIKNKSIEFYKITSGKLRRYLAVKNIWSVFFLIHGLFQSIVKITRFQPSVIISAGSFVGVPVIWAGWLMRVPILVHQQDYRPGLANKLSTPFAKKITVAFEKSLQDFDASKVVWAGNPVRDELFKGDKKRAAEIFHLEKDLPTVLIIGGGTGALKLNKLVAEAAPSLTEFCQIINITGLGRNVCDSFRRFHVYQLMVDKYKEALAVADIVVSRCGLGSLSELTQLAMPSILIPMPNTHQEDNVKPFIDKKAAVVLNQKELTPEILSENIKRLLANKEKQKELAENIQKVIKSGAAKAITDIVFEIAK